MRYRIYKKGVIQVACIKSPLAEEHEENMVKIPLFWEQAIVTEQFRQICTLTEREPYGVLGVSAYFNPKHISTTLRPLQVSPFPTGWKNF